jgi:hypothetical protein
VSVGVGVWVDVGVGVSDGVAVGVPVGVGVSVDVGVGVSDGSGVGVPVAGGGGQTSRDHAFRVPVFPRVSSCSRSTQPTPLPPALKPSKVDRGSKG